MINKAFWRNKHVLITGHTGFKGAWLCIWLEALGARVSGFALAPPTSPSLFQLSGVEQRISSQTGDIRRMEELEQAIFRAQPEIVIHMAAQPLVSYGYENPLETYETNVMGTVHLLEAVRRASLQGMPIRAVLMVTTDKCYENREWVWGYREQEPLGGRDPYSNSKACTEFVTTCYRESFFSAGSGSRVAVASARAGNVIGGGDWARDRLIPDCLDSLMNHRPIILRNPDAVRPWQHVLEPLGGYLMLIEKMWENAARFSQSYNFGPNEEDARTVAWMVQKLCEKWGTEASFEIEQQATWHEAKYLKLDCSKAKAELGWHPKWTSEEALDRIIEWTRCYQQAGNIRDLCLQQITQYMDGVQE
ncbi:CDP-glucose 4,6-dehydratase [Brevibacillus sp. AY1]|uniref:CDP-glucose 4,6-dehydratase n=1 Tax=Brevibacillus sp. AY1 TaxID=2807621 RepID=UPI0024565263|nr:CDP-glucose 4,6-dehydratase [Brevibacillus sp. AY1]MDH4617596.1 CDP-glucose 4,6-dehydratase [Brevibacillus sp. AY1]